MGFLKKFFWGGSTQARIGAILFISSLLVLIYGLFLLDRLQEISKISILSEKDESYLERLKVAFVAISIAVMVLGLCLFFLRKKSHPDQMQKAKSETGDGSIQKDSPEPS
jgi:hypothetical protein